MRLIDGAIQALPMSNYILERKETFIKVLENGDNDFLFAMLMEYFDEQPTAYDVDKVAQELKEISAIYCEEYKQREGSLYLQDAIEKVRKGGVE